MAPSEELEVLSGKDRARVKGGRQIVQRSKDRMQAERVAQMSRFPPC